VESEAAGQPQEILPLFTFGSASNTTKGSRVADVAHAVYSYFNIDTF
jgi:hypothetical protein